LYLSYEAALSIIFRWSSLSKLVLFLSDAILHNTLKDDTDFNFACPFFVFFQLIKADTYSVLLCLITFSESFNVFKSAAACAFSSSVDADIFLSFNANLSFATVSYSGYLVSLTIIPLSTALVSFQHSGIIVFLSLTLFLKFEKSPEG
jgi:hypothetical protein